VHTITDNEHKARYESRYWNCQGRNITIVASVTKGIDWAAYIGSDDSRTEKEAIEYALEYGSKLSIADAKYFFPELAVMPYRK